MKSRKLHLGCGTLKRKGWINIDANKRVKPDVVAQAHHLPMFKPNTIDVIEACHLFEHLTYLQALNALKEWYRILKPKGNLFLELPDFDRCIAILGKYQDPKGYDMGMIGIFGHPPMVKTDGLFQLHKWGWTFTNLKKVLIKIGFKGIKRVPITQTWRLASKMKTNRDMRVCAIKKD